MKVLIVEDEAPAFRRLQRILEDSQHAIEILDVLDTVEECVKWLNGDVHADLIFMDIQLADGLSFEIFEQIEVKTPVIFTTAYDEFALQAFKVNSIDYLLKPIDQEKLEQSLNKYENFKSSFAPIADFKQILKDIQPEKNNFKSRFLVRHRDRLISIKADQISYLLTETGLVYLYTKEDKKYIVDKTLDQIESQLDPEHFYRINRQIIANIEAISTAHAYERGKIMVELNPKTEKPTIVSREKASDFKRWMGLG